MNSPFRFAAFLHTLTLTALLGFASPLDAAEAAPSPREIIPFDTGWHFRLGDDPAAKQPNFDDTNWRTLEVPHDWSIEGPVLRPPEGGERRLFPARDRLVSEELCASNRCRRQEGGHRVRRGLHEQRGLD